ncbi:MAG: hypothetical protein C0598_02535 [Marinilabiliales bacterium]|nr:MAG: hypothetical protein C0598_02535 [Marinilabiliales bacterium]
MGTVKSLVMIDLYKLNKPTVPPAAFIENVIVNGNNIDFVELHLNKEKNVNQDIRFSGLQPYIYTPDNLSLPYNMNHLTFNCGATDWFYNHKIEFQYKLEGYDQDWNEETTNSMADYKNLSPGHYNFKLRAKGAFGKWSDIVEYKIIIRNPYWLSWWAFIIYLLIIVGFIWLIIDWRVNIVKRQKLILESIVAKRTKELNEAVVLADQAAVAKSQFIANMSHEIRTPLTAILGLSKLALESDKSEKIKSYLNKISGSANNMLVLINDLLDFSKIDAGKLKFEELSFKLQDVLNNTLIINSKLLGEKDIELIFKLSPEVPDNLIGDPIRVGQVISNLVNNALKFTEKGKVIVDVRLVKHIDEESVELQISVNDNGIGIEDKHLGYIFNEFEQADNSITRQFGGSGLGLAICKTLVDHMNGNIWVESKINIGSTFYFTIQLKKDKKITEVGIIPDINIILLYDDMARAKILQDHLSYYSLSSNIENKVEDLYDNIDNSARNLIIVDSKLLADLSSDNIEDLKRNKTKIKAKLILISDSEIISNQIISKTNLFDAALVMPVLPRDIINTTKLVFAASDEELIEHTTSEIDYDNISSKIEGKRVLVVEDNEIIRELIFELLTKVGVKVTMVENGAEAVEIVNGSIFNLILMDMHMPVMDGITATNKIREKGIETPIVVLTADTKQTLKEESSNRGINDVITKPIDNVLFYDVLIKAMHETDAFLENKSVSSNDKQNKKQVKFKYIDADSGIKRFGGNKKLFIKILFKFMHSNEDVCEQVKQCILEKDYKLAYLKCHSLKGESANISANQLFRVSEKLESSIKDKDLDNIEKNLIIVKNNLTNLLSELNEYFLKASEESQKEGNINVLLN